MSGYIPDYDIVRLDVLTSQGYLIDYPVHSEEEYNEAILRLEANGDNIMNAYQSIHSHIAEYNF
jgi:hypothetical protein